MVRPRKRRTIARSPRPAIYKPAGVPLEGLRQVVLRPDELEALRLSHLEGLSQSEAAGGMGISRSTYQRVLERAHRQVSLALVEGQALVLESSMIEVRPGGARRPDARQKHPG